MTDTMNDPAVRQALSNAIIEASANLPDKVITCIRIKWTQVGYELKATGFSFEYQDKPKRKFK